MASNSSEGEGFVWIIIFGLAIWFAYDKWWKEDDAAPVVPQPTYSARPTGLQYLTVTKSKTELALDADSVRGERSSRRAWVVSDHKKDTTTVARETKELYTVNCDLGSYRNPSIVQYDAKGATILSWDESEDDEAKTRHAIPGTIGNTIVNAICDSRYDPIPIPPPVIKK